LGFRNSVVSDLKQKEMKQYLLFSLLVMISIGLSAQESLIAGIMQVDPVNLTIGEEDQEKVDEYDAEFAEQQTELDTELAELGEEYANDITEMIEKFTNIMAEGDERKINNEKQSINTLANSRTFKLIKDKKATVQNFQNNRMIRMRDLPRPIQKMKEKELNTYVEDLRDKIHEEFEANQRVLKAFKATEHIKKTHISDMPETTDDSQ